MSSDEGPDPWELLRDMKTLHAELVGSLASLSTNKEGVLLLMVDQAASTFNVLSEAMVPGMSTEEPRKRKRPAKMVMSMNDIKCPGPYWRLQPKYKAHQKKRGRKKSTTCNQKGAPIYKGPDPSINICNLCYIRLRQDKEDKCI